MFQLEMGAGQKHGSGDVTLARVRVALEAALEGAGASSAGVHSFNVGKCIAPYRGQCPLCLVRC